ncbi:asparaginase [Moheibacter sediminis]|uniref:asparaginase n=1 Tax=Moheibacter sediminis TaxID=1434700 RepID=A0A1W2BR90_9FLAO|nr:asparaginase [Moheibacter sediminis]SMC75463.1 L-asparaginase [Moheibacter sediminis]
MATKILLIYTGGTIGMAKDYSNQSLKPFDFENLIKYIPELSLIDSEISYTGFDKPIDSSDMNPNHWIELAEIISKNYEKYDGFVVLHGTDTMAYTASAISFMLSGLQKPVIFTGSQLPVGDLRTDAKENLITSIHFASLHENGKPRIGEVCVYFEYKLLRANRTTKINAENFDAFESPNYPDLGESGIHLDVRKHVLRTENEVRFSVNKNLNTELGLIKIFPGMSQAFIENMFDTPKLKAMIIEAFGSGNVFSQDWFKDLLRKKSNEGMYIIVNTQCAGGMVEIGRYETSEIFVEIGALNGFDLTTEASVAKTIFLLGQNLTPEEFRNQYESDLRGELTHLTEY